MEAARARLSRGAPALAQCSQGTSLLVTLSVEEFFLSLGAVGVLSFQLPVTLGVSSRPGVALFYWSPYFVPTAPAMVPCS